MQCPSRRWTCPARRSEPAGTECCVVQRQRWLRSVHREREAMRSSLESTNGPACGGCSLESPTVACCGDDVDVSLCERRRFNRGLRTWRTRTGAPGNLGGLVVFTDHAGWTTRRSSPGAASGTRCSERTYVPTVIPRTEGNEGTRDGRRGVGAPHSTDEAGEPTRGTPWREGDTSRA